MSDMRKEFETIFEDIQEIYDKMSLLLNGSVRVLLGEHLLGNVISEEGIAAISRIIDMYNLDDCSLEDCCDEYDTLPYAAIILSEVSSALLESRANGTIDSIKEITKIYELLETMRDFGDWFAYESELLIEEGSDENDSE